MTFPHFFLLGSTSALFYHHLEASSTRASMTSEESENPFHSRLIIVTQSLSIYFYLSSILLKQFGPHLTWHLCSPHASIFPHVSPQVGVASVQGRLWLVLPQGQWRSWDRGQGGQGPKKFEDIKDAELFL